MIEAELTASEYQIIKKLRTLEPFHKMEISRNQNGDILSVIVTRTEKEVYSSKDMLGML